MSDISLLMKAANFAAVAHQQQRRKDPDGTPYVNHPIGVANILCNEAGIESVRVLMAALLHDTVEDTDTTLEEIERHFGQDVMRLVEEVTDDKRLPREERKRLQIETASSKSHDAKLIKLADMIYNLRDLNRVTPSGWTEQRVQDYFQWAANVFRNLRGAHAILEAKLADILQAKGIDLA